MGLEAATYIADLVSANPLTTDDKSQGDDHLRLLKAVLKAQFPNLGAAAVTPVAADLNQIAGLATASAIASVTAAANVTITAADSWLYKSGNFGMLFLTAVLGSSFAMGTYYADIATLPVGYRPKPSVMYLPGAYIKSGGPFRGDQMFWAYNTALGSGVIRAANVSGLTYGINVTLALAIPFYRIE